jgi:hypothetical protein
MLPRTAAQSGSFGSVFALFRRGAFVGSAARLGGVVSLMRLRMRSTCAVTQIASCTLASSSGRLIVLVSMLTAIGRWRSEI